MAKRFKVIDGPVSIRSQPAFGNTKIGELPLGIELDVDETSRTEAAGYVWWKHNAGWSAERKIDNSYVIMQEIPATETDTTDTTDTPTTTDEEPVDKLYYRVIDGPVSVRLEPRLGGDKVGEIALNAVIEVDNTSRAEFDGYIWWKHNAGWSAERKIDGSYIIMLLEPTPPDDSGGSDSGSGNDGTTTAEDDGTPTTTEPAEDIYFRVAIPVSVRSSPTIFGTYMGRLEVATEITNPNGEKVDADGYRWRKHSLGWSAQKKLDESEAFMVKIDELGAGGTSGGATGGSVSDLEAGEAITLPDGTTFTPLKMFTRTPVDFDKTMWIQYFGNSTFAHKIYGEGKRWYRYSQYLHGGFDYGNNQAGTPIYSGVQGRVVKLFRNSNVYSPNYLQVAVDNYLIIYGHLANPPEFSPGQIIQPDTVVGFMDAGGQNHLHLEVRYKSWWIINPLLVMTDDVRDPILNKYTNLPRFFYSDAGWNQWGSPFDQPILRLTSTDNGIGPHFR